eukprot:2033256-Pleurochrysis_carterae.AAC.3
MLAGAKSHAVQAPHPLTHRRTYEQILKWQLGDPSLCPQVNLKTRAPLPPACFVVKTGYSLLSRPGSLPLSGPTSLVVSAISASGPRPW